MRPNGGYKLSIWITACALTLFICSMLAAKVSNILLKQHSMATGIDLAFRSQQFDFGDVLGGKKLLHTFDINNPSQDELLIRKIVPGCGCTSASVEMTTVPPHQSTRLHVEYSPSPVPGVQRVAIAISVSNPSESVKVITLQCRVNQNYRTNLPLLCFSPEAGPKYTDLLLKIDLPRANASFTGFLCSDIPISCKLISEKSFDDAREFKFSCTIAVRLLNSDIDRRLSAKLRLFFRDGGPDEILLPVIVEPTLHVLADPSTIIVSGQCLAPFSTDCYVKVSDGSEMTIGEVKLKEDVSSFIITAELDKRATPNKIKVHGKLPSAKGVYHGVIEIRNSSDRGVAMLPCLYFVSE